MMPEQAGAAQTWTEHRFMWFRGQFDSNIKTGADYDTQTLDKIWTIKPGDQPKGSGWAFIPSSMCDHDGREHAAQRERGQYIALTGDIDGGNHDIETIRAGVTEFVAGAAWLIYSSPYSRPGDQRWRVIIPLAEVQSFPRWHDAQLAFFGFMEARGIEMDHALARAAQPVYLPNVPAIHAKTQTPLRGDDGKPLYFVREGSARNLPGLSISSGPVEAGIFAIHKRRMEDERERERIRKEAEARRAAQPRSDNANLIDDFNAANSVATMLEMSGYQQDPRHPENWRSPLQTSETYATAIFGSKWVSLSASDASSGLGERCASGCYGDAYDLFVHYQHGGDHKSAFRTLHAERRSDSPNVVYLRDPPAYMDETPPHEEMPEWVEAETDHCEAILDMVAAEPEQHWPEPVDLWARYEEPELPAGLLPTVLDRFTQRQAAIMGADPAGMAMAALCVCAAAVPDCIELQVKRNDPTWREHARLWVALVGPPSRKKTPIFKAAIAPLRRVDNQLMKAYLQACDEYENLDKDAKKAAPKPAQRRLIISDTTIEAAQEVMMDSPDGVLSEQDELSGWFGAMDRYNTKGGGDRAFWLKAFNGGTYNLNRIGRGAKQIPNLSISLLGGIQPEPMRKFAGESVDDGLLQRMLPVILRPSTVGKDAAQDESAADYDQLVSRLYAMRAYGEVTLHFSDGARAVRDQLEREHLDLSNALETVSPKLSAHYGKYDGIFARLCILWHCIENAYSDLPSEIGADTAQTVEAFMREFIRPSAIAFYAGTLGMSAGHEDVVNLAAVIVGKGMDEVAARDAQRAGQTMRHVTADQFRLLAEKLEAFGWLEKREPKARSNTPHWIVNPRVHDMFAARAELEMARRDAAKQALHGAIKGGIK